MAADVASVWTERPLEECMEAIIDYRGKTPAKKSFGIPLVTAKVVKNGRIETPQEFIAPEDYDEWMRRGLPRAGDVVMTTEAPLGEIAQLDGTKIALAQRIITLRGKADVLESNYLKYAMQSAYVQEQLRARASGTTVLGIKQSELRRVTLRFPPLPAQRAIAHVLGTLDDKMELNRRTNETLEALTRALFTSWFIEFDPVHAKANGRPPHGLDAATAKLFPDEFWTSNLGKIPKGWRVLPLDEIADFRNGLALQRFRPTSGSSRLPVVKIAQLRTGEADSGEWARDDIEPSCIIADGDIVFSWSGSLTVVVWCGGRAALNQHLFRVTSSRYPKWFYLRWLHSHLAEFQRIAGDKATTMGHIQRHHLSAAMCVVPESPLLEHVSKRFESLLQEQVLLELETRSLRSVRDALLPRLLSGEVELPAALVERQAGE